MKRKELLLGIPVAAIAIVCIVCIVCVVCSGCNSFHGRQRATHGGDNSSADTLQGSPRELPLPEVPALLTAPEERAAYVLEHFWDGMDFRDTLRSRDRLFMEQCFVNFLSLFPHALPQSLPSPVGRLLQRAAVDSVAFRLVNSLAEHYLDDPNSPMRNEEHYILFLEALLSLPGLPEAERIRPAYRLETTRKNRPGTIAADFAYTDHRGKRQTLHGTPAPPAPAALLRPCLFPLRGDTGCLAGKPGSHPADSRRRTGRACRLYRRRPPPVGRDESCPAAGMDGGHRQQPHRGARAILPARHAGHLPAGQG